MNEIFKLFGTIAIKGVDDAEDDIKDLTGTVEKSESKLVGAFKNIGAAVVAAFAVDKIISFGQEIVNAAATVAAEESAFAQIMGDYADEATEKLGLVADETGKVDTALTPYMTSMTAKFKGLGFGIEEATDYAVDGLLLASDASAFWDMSLEESMSHLNSFINGSYEGGEAIGLFANDTQMAMYAVEQGLVSTKAEWAALDEKTKQATRMQYAQNMMKLSGATGQASKESKQYANVQANLTEHWRQFKAELGEPLLQNVVTPAMIALSGVVENLTETVKNCKQWVSENGDTIQKWTGFLVGATTTVGTFLLIMNWGSIMKAAATALTWVQGGIYKLNRAIASNPIGAIASLIAGLIAWLIYLYNTNEDFRAFVNEMLGEIWSKLQEVFGWIQENVLPILEEILAWIESNVLPVIQSVIAWIQENVIPAISEFLSWLTETLSGFWEWLTGLFEGGSGTLGAIWETIKGFFISAWEVIQSVWAFCKPFFDGIWNGIILPVAGLISEIIGAFKMAWDVIVLVWGYAKPFFAAIWEGIKAVFSVVGAILGGFFKSAWEVIKLVWGVAVEHFKLIWAGIKAVFSVVGAVLGGFFKVAWEVIKAVWNVAISFFTMVWAGIKAVFAVVKGVLSGNFSDAWDAIKNLWSRVVQFFSAVWNGIKGIFGATASWFGGVFKAAWNAIKNVFSSWGSFFAGLWNRITNTFKNIGTNIADAIGGAVKSGINGVIGMIEKTINGAIGLINGAINLINELPGVSVGKISKVSLPRLAQGGVVNEPTIAEIGENGAEAVVPLENNTGWINRVAEKLSDFIVKADFNADKYNSAEMYSLQRDQIEETRNTNDKLDALLELLEMFFPQLLEAAGHDIVADDGTILAYYAPLFDERLGKIAVMKGRGR